MQNFLLANISYNDMDYRALEFVNPVTVPFLRINHKFSTRKLYFKPKLQKYVPANNYHVATYLFMVTIESHDYAAPLPFCMLALGKTEGGAYNMQNCSISI